MEYIDTEVAVLGAGPGGYTAAFYAADKGRKVLLIDAEEKLGGVCLKRGCIPTKALLNAAHLLNEAKESEKRGIRFAPPEVDLDKLRAWKDSVVNRLTQGLEVLRNARGVSFLRGRGRFEDSSTIRVETPEGQKFVRYQKAIVAVGSEAVLPKSLDLGNPRVMTSTGALELVDIPEELLIVGGGYIGLEMGTVFAALGSKITLVEALGSILAGLDEDLVRPVMWSAQKRVFKEMNFNTKVMRLTTEGKKILAVLEAGGKTTEKLFDRVLVAVGRAPNCRDLGLENTKITLDDRGFVKINNRQETTDRHIYAVGDVAGGVMLAHKASREARIAVEAILGGNAVFDSVIPAVVYTDPEIVMCGLSETEAKKKGIAYEVARFPWPASGRAVTLDRVDGLTKLIIEPGTERILGAGIVGAGAGELIGEATLAVEMGATAKDLAETVHAHPTLSETLMECAESFYGVSTNSLAGRKR